MLGLLDRGSVRRALPDFSWTGVYCWVVILVSRSGMPLHRLSLQIPHGCIISQVLAPLVLLLVDSICRGQ